MHKLFYVFNSSDVTPSGLLGSYKKLPNYVFNKSQKVRVGPDKKMYLNIQLTSIFHNCRMLLWPWYAVNVIDAATLLQISELPRAG